MLLSASDCETLMRKIHAAGNASLVHLLQDFAAPDQNRVRRTVGWLLKTGLLRIEPQIEAVDKK
jgi:hypothetical protein